MMDDQVTRNFTLGEFLVSQEAARKGIDNTPSAAVLAQLRNVTIPAMQAVRDLLAVPVIVTSGFRSLELNRAIGGSSDTSQHVLGQACDFSAPAYGSPRKVAELLAVNVQRIKFDQLIHEGGWVHVSFAARPRLEVLTAHFNGAGRASYTRGL